MRTLMLLLGLVMLYGCASADARRVDCKAHLTDINPSAQAKSASVVPSEDSSNGH